MSPFSLTLALVLSILIMINKADEVTTTDQTYLHHTCLQGSGNENSLNNVLKFCRGDVPSSDCDACLSTAETEIKSYCPDTDTAVIWYDYCELKISGSPCSSGQVYDQDHSFTMAGHGTVSDDPVSFNRKVQDWLFQLTGESFINVNPPKYFAKGSMVVDESTTVYGLTQCSPDLSPNDCWTCLQSILGSLSSCCDGKDGGRVATVSSFARYGGTICLCVSSSHLVFAI